MDFPNGTKAFEWIFTIDWLNSLKKAFSTIVDWFTNRKLIIEQVTVSIEEQKILNEYPEIIMTRNSELNDCMSLIDQKYSRTYKSQENER